MRLSILAKLGECEHRFDVPSAQLSCALASLSLTMQRTIRLQILGGPSKLASRNHDACSQFSLLLSRTVTQPQLAKRSVILARKLRKRRKVFNGRRLKLFLQQRNQLFSNPRAELCRVAIGGVLAPRLFLLFQIYAQICSPDSKQRPDYSPLSGMNSADARQTRSAQNMRQHCLRLIVRRVCNGDLRDFSFSDKRREKSVARAPPRILNIQFFAFRLRRDIRAADVEIEA